MREITVMFTDVRGFTRISEQFDPHGLTRFMNRFLTPMTDLILGNRGTIDKYMGDAIMAFWNAPLAVEGHAARACDTALAMQAQLRVLNEEWRAEAEAAGPRAHSGGHRHRPQHRPCLGRQLRLDAALHLFLPGQRREPRLAAGRAVQDLPGRHHHRRQDPRSRLPGYATLELDLVMLKGKTEPERAHALLGGVAMAQTPAYQELVRRQAEFLAQYRSAGFAEALELIAGLPGRRGCPRLEPGILRDHACAR